MNGMNQQMLQSMYDDRGGEIKRLKDNIEQRDSEIKDLSKRLVKARELATVMSNLRQPMYGERLKKICDGF